MQAREGNLKLRGDFRFGGVAPEAAFAVLHRLFESPRLAAKRARTPIHLPKAIENRAAYAEFGIVLELNIFVRIVFAYGIHQAEDSGVNQIFKQHLGRQTIVDAPGNVLHLLQVIEKKPFALRLVKIQFGLGRSLPHISQRVSP